MTLPRLLRLVIPLGMMLGSLPVLAQTMPRCQFREGDLKREHRKEPVARGTVDGGVAEVLASPDGRTWTIIVSTPGGATCLVAAGEAWQAVEPQAHGESM